MSRATCAGRRQKSRRPTSSQPAKGGGLGVRIILHSNLDAPWSVTGYGQQTALLAPRLRDAGHEVAISAFWGLAGGPLAWEGIPVYPSGDDLYGNDILAGHARHFGADLVITLMDMWVLSPDLLSSLPVACWMPVDTRPLGKADHIVLTAAGSVIPVAMSVFGRDRLAEAGVRPCYVPKGARRDREVRHRHQRREQGHVPQRVRRAVRRVRPFPRPSSRYRTGGARPGRRVRCPGLAGAGRSARHPGRGDPGAAVRIHGGHDHLAADGVLVRGAGPVFGLLLRRGLRLAAG